MQTSKKYTTYSFSYFLFVVAGIRFVGIVVVVAFYFSWFCLCKMLFLIVVVMVARLEGCILS